MAKETLGELRERVKEWAKDDLVSCGPDGDVNAHMLMFNDGKLTMVLIDGAFFEPKGREKLPMVIAGLIVENKPSLVAMVSSAWTAPPGESRPSTHPNRREVVFVMIRDHEATEFWDAPITRRENESPLLGDWRRHPLANGDGAVTLGMEAGFRAIAGA